MGARVDGDRDRRSRGRASAATSPPDPSRVRVIACATVIDELAPRLPPDVRTEVLDFGLHRSPQRLTDRLQAAIDRTHDADVILLGYGLCSGGVVGLRATTASLVIPRVDDCIGLFLGSQRVYRAAAQRAPGTFYLTAGWLEAGDTPLDEERRLRDRYGAERAARIVECMLSGYTRLVLIRTAGTGARRDRAAAEAIADRYGLEFAEVDGAPTLVDRLVTGPWDDEFVVVPPGGEVTLADFLVPRTAEPCDER